MKLRDLPPIDESSPSWVAVREWAEAERARLRQAREMEKADLRDLDVALGAVKQLDKLLGLPAAIQGERKRDPVADTDFGIPNL